MVSTGGVGLTEIGKFNIHTIELYVTKWNTRYCLFQFGVCVSKGKDEDKEVTCLLHIWTVMSFCVKWY